MTTKPNEKKKLCFVVDKNQAIKRIYVDVVEAKLFCDSIKGTIIEVEAELTYRNNKYI